MAVRKLNSTLRFRQDALPVCLVLGLTLPGFALLWLALRIADIDLVITAISVWTIVVVASVGLMFLGLGIFFALSSRSLAVKLGKLESAMKSA
jgi:hypothetical protein